MRKKIIAGNWKMNKTPEEAAVLCNILKNQLHTDNVDVVFCVPFISIISVVKALAGTDIAIGAQNMYFEESGAYTGEIAPNMLKEAGVSYVIIGHSERREYFGESDETVNKKITAALAHQLIPIVCVGESLLQREQNITMDFIRMQIKIAFNQISAGDAKKIVIAYEPIWAIGTGKTATKEQAEDVCKGIRDTMAELYDKETASHIRIQYGGSVNGKNAAELFSMPNIDGGLVGGASIKEEFAQIVNF